MERSAASTPGIAYGAVPWLLVNGVGLWADDLADQLAEQVRAHDLEPVRRTVDDIDDLDLAFFPGAVVILPEVVPKSQRVSQVLTPCKEFVLQYRARRPRSIRQGRILGSKAWECGALQAVGRNVMLGSSILRPVRDRWCVEHRVEGDAKVDLFELFETAGGELPDLAAAPSGHQVAQGAYYRAAERLTRWNIQPHEALAVLDTIDSCRRDVEARPRRATKHRPITSIARNRLDLMLDGPPATFTAEEWTKAIGDPKTWQEADASVWRDVWKKIEKRHTTVRYPTTGHTGAVEALRALYSDLRIVSSSLLR